MLENRLNMNAVRHKIQSMLPKPNGRGSIGGLPVARCRAKQR